VASLRSDAYERIVSKSKHGPYFILPTRKGETKMKKAKSKWIVLAVALALIVVLAVAACGGSDEPKGTVVIVDQDWDGQLVTTRVVQILLEQEMGYTVETKFAAADSAPLFIGLESGDFHFVCCNWPSYSFALLDEYVNPGGNESVERLGSTGIVGETGWYTPSYVVEGADAPAPGLDNWDELDQFKSVFATADTGESGRLLGFTPAWDDRSQERLEAMGADYQVVFAGSEAAALSELDGAFNRGDPVLTYLWEPHWAHAKYNLVQIEMPPLTDDCYPAGNADFFECGWPADDVAKLVWPGLNEEFPEVYEFLSNFQMTNAQQNEMVLNVTDNEITPLEAAQAWVDANEDVWKEWIP
jgi:glycine betaine/proline transport system substrate-binding protein